MRRTEEGKWTEDHQEKTKTEDRSRAEELARLYEATLNTGTAPGGELTLPAIMEARIADMARDPTKSPESVAGFRVSAKKLNEVFGSVPAVKIDRKVLLAAQDKLRSELGPETVNTYFRKAAACWRWCEERGYVDKPWPKIRPLKKPPSKKRPYTPVELEQIKAWVREWRKGRAAVGDGRTARA